MSNDGFVKLVRVVTHPDPDMLAACLVRLHMQGYTSWTMGRFLTQDYGWKEAIARPIDKIGEYSHFVFDEWPLIKDFDPFTLGRQERHKFSGDV